MARDMRPRNQFVNKSIVATNGNRAIFTLGTWGLIIPWSRVQIPAGPDLHFPSVEMHKTIGNKGDLHRFIPGICVPSYYLPVPAYTPTLGQLVNKLVIREKNNCLSLSWPSKNTLEG
jgi:hypothetical protein